MGIRIPKTNAWGRVVGEQTAFVKQIHEQRARAYVDSVVRYGRVFLALMLGGAVGLLGFAAAGWDFAAGASVVLMGLTALYLPFATPQTVEMFGIATARVMARVGGGVLVVAGVVIASGVLGE